MLISNHYLIDWEQRAIDNAEGSIARLIADQRTDLKDWSNRVDTDPDFSKRTLCKGRLVEWNDDHPFEFESSTDSIYILENERGIFLVQSLEIGGCQFLSQYALYRNYSITNQYLKSGIGDRLHPSIDQISSQGSQSYGQLLKYDVSYAPSKVIDSIISGIIVFILLFTYWLTSKSSFRHFLLATIMLIILRLITLGFDILQVLFQMPLFDPINYTSSFINPTLGDLLINQIILLLICMRLVTIFDYLKPTYGWILWGGLGISLSILLFHIPWSILSNSQILLDVGESIIFDWLRIVSYICLLLTGLSFLIYTFYVQKYLASGGKIYQTIALSIVVALVLLFTKLLIAASVLFFGAILFVSSRISWNDTMQKFNYSNLLFILMVSVGTGMLFAAVTYKQSEQSELDAKEKFANYLLLKRDVLGEYYLHQSIQKLSQDTRVMEVASEGSREELESIIRREFASSYFNKYDLEIVFQDYQRLSRNTRFTREYSLLDPEFESDYENIYFIDEGTNFKYISKVNFGDLVGLVILQIKKRVPTTVYPALLTDSKYASATDDFDYAVFADDNILFHRSKFGQGEWPTPEDFENPDLYDEGIEKNERHYFGVKTSDGRTILIISEIYSKRALVANFSFFFLLLLAVSSLYSTAQSIKQHGLKLNFTSKIQFYLSLAFIIPLLATGFALLSTLNASYKEEIDRSYLKQALYISEILSDELEGEMGDEGATDLLSEISNYIQSDISFYNESGYLIATSQPDIFDLGLQSNLVNPIVFSELVMKENQSIVAEESIGLLDYKVCYALVNTQDNQVAGFIAMPFFDSRNHLRRQQIEVFGNLISIFGIVFILAILIGNAVVNNLLQPLRMVAGKIREVTLQDVNKPIDYVSSDEIGSLVRDYNQMLVKLEESKLALARSQKESAWKEIARQVAHEIKNPLTPMQLKIQQMMRRYEQGSRDYDMLSSLLTQVDALSQIAQSFSAFAEMPAPDNKVLNWAYLVEDVVRLYQSEEVMIEVDCDTDAEIEADEDIFRRILNNIVLNAIQSTESKPARIFVRLEKKTGKAILSVQDNGRGIPEEIRDMIFMNYFSTKSTGSGIGLALAKKGIENAGGNIWFESNEGEGTTFYISMPLVDH
ncbi:MAG: HAMP domain-containing sensor histidine kinase [Ekhidna sp.]